MPPNDRQGQARPTAKPTVLVTIEAMLPQLIGAFMQKQSFLEANTAADYFLCIVSDSVARAGEFAEIAGELGTTCVTSIGRSTNRYLHKWRVLDHLGALRRIATPDGRRPVTSPATLHDDPVLLLDWDVLNTARETLPFVTHGIGARRNPSDLYAEVIGVSPTARALTGSRTELATSVNGGVLASSPALFKRCAARTEFIIAALREDGVNAPDWKVEQFALSLAVGEIGFKPLDDRWNVTTVSPVDDRDVAFWHYNDSIPSTRRLKQSLACPDSVAELLLELDERWPRQTEVFRRLYSGALDSKPLQRALERHSATFTTVC